MVAPLVQGRQSRQSVVGIMQRYGICPLQFRYEIVSNSSLLHCLVVNIFANRDYVTWIMHTIEARGQNSVYLEPNVPPDELLALHRVF